MTHALRSSFLELHYKLTNGRRLWKETSPGKWSSYQPTKEDIKRIYDLATQG